MLFLTSIVWSVSHQPTSSLSPPVFLPLSLAGSLNAHSSGTALEPLLNERLKCKCSALSLSVFLFLFSLHVLLFSLVPLHPLFPPREFLVERSKWVWVWKLFFPRWVNALNSVPPPTPFPLFPSIFLVLYLGKNRCRMRADRVYASHEHFNRNWRLRILLSHRDWIEKAHHLHPQMILPCQDLLWLHTWLWHAHAYATPSHAWTLTDAYVSSSVSHVHPGCWILSV